MNSLLPLLAPIALLLPEAARTPAPETELAPQPERIEPATADATERLEPLVRPTAAQVRIEQRVVIRIAPPGPAVRQGLVAEALQPRTPRLVERKMGECVPVSGIAAVQPDAGSRLLLMMRDRRLISASLEKSCRARDFYSGFYLERSSDGKLCVERDKLHSRAGSNCEISRMRQLVPED